MLNDPTTIVVKGQIVSHPNTDTARADTRISMGSSTIYGQSSVTEIQKLEENSGFFVTAMSPAITGAYFSRDLTVEYQDLGEALTQLLQVEFEDERKIDEQTYKSAYLVAGYLHSNSIPAPRLFTHGSRAIVFTWSTGEENRYVTISREAVSTLVSTHSRIERRAEYEISPGTIPNGTTGYIGAIWIRNPKLLGDTTSDTTRRDQM